MARSIEKVSSCRVKDEAYLRVMFGAVDPEDTGVVDRARFGQLVANVELFELGSRDLNALSINQVFKEVDVAECGEIEFDQFVQFFREANTTGKCGPAEKPMPVLAKLAETVQSPHISARCETHSCLAGVDTDWTLRGPSDERRAGHRSCRVRCVLGDSATGGSSDSDHGDGKAHE